MLSDNLLEDVNVVTKCNFTFTTSFKSNSHKESLHSANNCTMSLKLLAIKKLAKNERGHFYTVSFELSVKNKTLKSKSERQSI